MRGVTGYLNGLMSELATGLTAYGVVTDPPAICSLRRRQSALVRSAYAYTLCLHPTLFFAQKCEEAWGRPNGHSPRQGGDCTLSGAIMSPLMTYQEAANLLANLAGYD